MDKPVEQLLLDNYSTSIDSIFAPLLDWLLAVRGHFNDDLDLFVIFLVISLRTTGDPRAQALDFAAVERGEIEEYPSLLTNVRSIAESTGIPYETTRRKVDRLLALGWVERRAGGLALSVKASHEFVEIRGKLLAMVANCHDVVDALRRGPHPGGPGSPF